MNSKITLAEINKLAVPALIAGVSEPILSLTDLAIVGNVPIHPTQSIAAIGIVTTFLSMLIWVLGQTRSAISSIVSQYLGANNLEAIKKLPAQAIAIITAISLLIILFTLPFSNSIFKLYNASDIILEYSVRYYNIRVFGFPFTLYTIAIFGVFRGLQNTYYPMLIACSGAVINILLDVVLVYGITDFIPALHIKGAAYASVIAQCVMAILSTYFLLKKTSIPLRISFPFNPEIKRFLSMIGNLIIRTLALNITLYIATSNATKYGENDIAAYTIAINLWFLGAFIIDGYASAGNILSGKLLGAKHFSTLIDLSNKLIRYGCIVGLVLASIGFIVYIPIGHMFTKSEAVRTTFYNCFWIVLIMQPFCALAFIFDGMFKGLGQMKTLRNLLLISTFVIFIPLVYLFNHYNLKLYCVFTALTLWIIARGIPLIIIFRKQFLPLSQKP